MSISLYCHFCKIYQGELNPSESRNYAAVDAETRRYRNFICRQCEAEIGRYEGRIHARHNWNLAMRGHKHVIADCKKTITELGHNSLNVYYSIGMGGYTVLEPARSHFQMISTFTYRDALCLLTLGTEILNCKIADIKKCKISENFAVWIALMRHVECSKMTKAAVGIILDKIVNSIKIDWEDWRTELSSLIDGNKEYEKEYEKNYKKNINIIGNYLSTQLNRTNAERESSTGEKKSHTAIPSTPNSGK